MSCLLIVMSPSELCSILSIPLGPNELRKVRETAFAARILALTASTPRTRDFLSCSCDFKHQQPFVHNIKLARPTKRQMQAANIAARAYRAALL